MYVGVYVYYYVKKERQRVLEFPKASLFYMVSATLASLFYMVSATLAATVAATTAW
jgi:hypothetical protein